MSIEVIDRDGVRQVVDVTPVEEFEQELRESIRKREFFKCGVEQIDALKKMDCEQLLRIAAILTFMVEEYASLYDGSFSPEHAKLVQQLREIRRVADEAYPGALETWGALDERKR